MREDLEKEGSKKSTDMEVMNKTPSLLEHLQYGPMNKKRLHIIILYMYFIVCYCDHLSVELFTYSLLLLLLFLLL